MHIAHARLRSRPPSRASGVDAIVDFELATLGSRWGDVCYFLMYIPPSLQFQYPCDLSQNVTLWCMWHLIPSTTKNYGLAREDGSVPEGIPSMRELLGMYCSLSGVAAPPDNHLRFYVCAALFKMASILHGVLCRSLPASASVVHA